MLVWACEGITDAAAAVLTTAGHKVTRDLEWYPHWAGEIQTKFALWTRLSPKWGPYHPAVVAWKPEIVATPCTDSSHCDEARKKGVRVLSLRDCGDLSSIRATVEHTVGLILSLTRRIPAAAESVRRGEWDRMQFRGADLSGKVAFIVGYGRVGHAVGEILWGFGVDVMPYDPKLNQARSTVLSLLPQADLITVHASLNETSRNMFGPAEFAAMKPGAYFVNTARGAIVDEWALLDSLKSGHLAGAALDVLQNEPPNEFGPNPLVTFARENPTRLIITPHLGGCSVESMEKAECLLARKLVEVLADGGQ